MSEVLCGVWRVCVVLCLVLVNFFIFLLPLRGMGCIFCGTSYVDDLNKRKTYLAYLDAVGIRVVGVAVVAVVVSV